MGLLLGNLSSVTSMKLVLPSKLHQVLLKLGIEQFPREACALLIGSEVDEGEYQISDIGVSDNIADNPYMFFEVDPATRIRVEKQCRMNGTKVIGVFHTHPNGKSEPSRTDSKMIYEPGLVWLIAGQTEATLAEICAYIAKADMTFEALQLEVTGEN